MPNGETALEKLEWMKKEEARLKGMGGEKRIEEQHGRGKYTARERVEKLYDPGTFFEIGLWCKSESLGYDLYKRVSFKILRLWVAPLEEDMQTRCVG